jgi:hypothetical protein
MKNQVQVTKHDGINVIGEIEFETRNGDKKVVQIWKKKFRPEKFYVVSGTHGVFDNYEKLQNNFVALRNITEPEILNQLDGQ